MSEQFTFQTLNPKYFLFSHEDRKLSSPLVDVQGVIAEPSGYPDHSLLCVQFPRRILSDRVDILSPQLRTLTVVTDSAVPLLRGLQSPLGKTVFFPLVMSAL